MNKKQLRSVEKTVKALGILEAAGEDGIRPSEFAPKMWPNSPCWQNARKCGKTGVHRGMGMYCSAGCYLGNIVRRGLAEKIAKVYRLIPEGQKFLNENKGVKTTTAEKLSEHLPKEAAEIMAEGVIAEPTPQATE